MLKINDANDFRRTGAGLCLIVGPLLMIVGGLVASWENSETTAAWFEALAAAPGRAQLGTILLYFAFLLVAVGVFGMVHLLRRRSVVLGHVGGLLAGWGWITVTGLLVVDFYDLALAQAPDRREAIATAERAEGYAGAAVIGIPGLLAIIGIVLLAVALWRAQVVPVWVPVLVLASIVASFIAPIGVVAWALTNAPLAAALGYVGLKILGMSDKEWEHGVSPATEPSHVI